MTRIANFYNSVVGKKVIVAATGLAMLGFLVAHVVGNLKVFLPDPEPGVPDIDVYAQALRTFGEPFLPHAAFLWAFRAFLLGTVVLHVITVLQLAAINRAARPVGYQRQRFARASRSALLMMVSGLLLLAYLVFHLLHLTVGWVDAANFEHGALYFNLYNAFATGPMMPLYVAIYLIGMVVVSFHLYHGAWSAFQTLGIDNPDRNTALRWTAIGLAVVLFVLFSAIPIAFATGLMDPPPEPVGHSEHSSAGGAAVEPASSRGHLRAP